MDDKINISADASSAIENVMEAYVVGKIKKELSEKSDQLDVKLFGRKPNEDDNITKEIEGKIKRSGKTLKEDIIKTLSNSEDEDFVLTDFIDDKAEEINQQFADLKSRSDDINSQVSELFDSNEKTKTEMAGLTKATKKLTADLKKSDDKLSEIESENERIKNKLYLLIALEGLSVLGITAIIILFFIK